MLVKKFFRGIIEVRQKMIELPSGIESMKETQEETAKKIEELNELIFDGEARWFMDDLSDGKKEEKKPIQLNCSCKVIGGRNGAS
jgi:hypothetical protein